MNSKYSDLLVCGAFSGETDLLQNKVNILNTHVGNISAAIHLQHYLFHNPLIKKVIFAGSAGFYHNDFSIGDIVYSNEFINFNPALMREIIKVPDIMQTNISTNPVSNLIPYLHTIKKGTTNSFSGITIIDPDNNDYAKLKKLHFENMESFGLASVCSMYDIEFTALYSLTNKVGISGSNEWQQNWKMCSKKLQTFITSFLSEKKEI